MGSSAMKKKWPMILCLIAFVFLAILLGGLLVVKHMDVSEGTIRTVIGDAIPYFKSDKATITQNAKSPVKGVASAHTPDTILERRPEDLYGAADGITQQNLGLQNLVEDAGAPRAPTPEPVQPKAPGRKSIGLPATISSQTVIPDRLSGLVRNQLQANFIRTGKYDVIEIDGKAQAHLDAELDRSLSNVVTDEHAAALGRLAGIQYLAIPEIEGFHVEAGSPGGVGDGAPSTLVARLNLSVKLVDTSTHRILEQRQATSRVLQVLPMQLKPKAFSSVTITKETPRSVEFLQIAKVEGYTEEKIAELVKTYSDLVLENLAKRAADDLIEVINARLYPVKVIAHIDGFPVINAGVDNQVNVGDLFEVFETTHIQDPDTGAVLTFGKRTAVLRVRSAMDKTASCELVSGLDAPVGSELRRISASELNQDRGAGSLAAPVAPSGSGERGGARPVRPVQRREVSDW